jgi:hypothetical protein
MLTERRLDPESRLEIRLEDWSPKTRLRILRLKRAYSGLFLERWNGSISSTLSGPSLLIYFPAGLDPETLAVCKAWIETGDSDLPDLRHIIV